MPKAAKGGFYAVNKGRATGVFMTWDECEAQIKGFPGAKFKKFMNAADAEAFASGKPVPSGPMSPTKARASSPPKSKSTAPTSAPVPASTSAPQAAVVSTSEDAQKESVTITKNTGKTRIASGDLEDESGWDIVYCDGACKGNGQVGSVAGVGVWWGHNDPRNIAERCPGDQTNNRAELIAMSRVLETAPYRKRPLLIKTDSKYSMKCVKDWMPKWIANDFRTSKNEPVKNAELIRYLSGLLDARAKRGQKVQLEYVKGHSGDTGNDGADFCANMGARCEEIPERDWVALLEALESEAEAPNIAEQAEETVVVENVVADKGKERVEEGRSYSVEPEEIDLSLYSDGLLSDEELARVAFDSDEEAEKREKTPTKNVPPVHLSQPKAPAIAPEEDIDFSIYEDALLDDDDLALELLAEEMS
ncbi:hypothetical protein PLICRDRAFT_151900 [Plicaturopsis crispa FD-325 SS-3]|nr:hypothetical protein PLICRDRAFT_151900 [Plicaturopsis crispa FD-325 SS-3]